jgi:uncharacterized protein YcbK (DUF882 family)
MDWSVYPNFSKKEFDCKHSGKNRMRPEFMQKLQEIRDIYNRVMIINSGYRDKTHPIEAAKKTPGEHYYGAAADVKASGVDAMELIVIAFTAGIRRIGVRQHGGIFFIHLGLGDQLANFPQSIWTYSDK